MSVPLHYSFVLNATPARVYAALTDSDQFAKFTGDPATIGSGAGDSFSCFGGMIEGRQVELVPDVRIVQAWRVKNWQPGVYSIVKFELKAHADGTTLAFEHAGFPEEHRPHLHSGWHVKYWEPLKKYLSETNGA